MPENLEKAPVRNNSIIFSEGETTGHYHACVASSDIDVRLDKESGEIWAQVFAPTEVTHQEHGAVTLDPGVYKVGIVREVDPFAEEIRKVAD